MKSLHTYSWNGQVGDLRSEIACSKSVVRLETYQIGALQRDCSIGAICKIGATRGGQLNT